MLTEEQRRRGAEDILRAERERKPIPQLSRTFPGMEIEDAYRVQDLWTEGRIAKGARVIGHKIGLTSRAMQMASKMTERIMAVFWMMPATAMERESRPAISSNRGSRWNWLSSWGMNSRVPTPRCST
jgi:2-keto-4-pentenoate hydratase